MDVYIPTLESNIVALVSAFRFVVFFILVAGLIISVASDKTHVEGLFGVIVRATIIVAAIAYQEDWFPKVEQGFLATAEYINPGYNNHPTAAADTIRESTTKNPDGQAWSWRHLSESLYQSFVTAIASLFIYLGTLLTVPMLILQYILRWLLYLITPFALSLFMLPSLTGLGVRFIQQVLAILAWPVGFALTDMVSLAIWKDFTATINPSALTVSDAVYAPLMILMGGLLATIMLIVGMISTPVVMQMLFAQGHAFTGASANPMAIARVTAALSPRQGSSAAVPPPPPPPLPPARVI